MKNEINMIDVLLRVISSWKKLIAAALIGAVLLAGASIVRGVTQGTGQVLSDLEQSKREKNELMSKKLEAYEKEYNNRLEYMDNSVYFNLSSNEKPIASALIAVTSDNQTRSNTIALAYKNALKQKINWSVMTTETGCEQKYLEELLTVGLESNVLSVSIAYSDVDTAEGMLKEILKQVNNWKTDYIKSLGEHELNVISTNKGIVVDTTVTTKKDTTLKEAQNMYDSLTKAKDEINSLGGTIGDNAAGNHISIVSVVKRVIVGAVIGMLVYAGGVFFAYVLKDSLKADTALKSTGLAHLGTIDDREYSDSISRWIHKLETGNRKLTHKEVIERCGINIKCLKGQAEKILITGCADDNSLQQLCSELSAAGIASFVCAGNVNINSSTIEQINDADAVVLAEKIDVSRFSDIVNEIDTIKSLKKEIIGFIAIR